MVDPAGVGRDHLVKFLQQSGEILTVSAGGRRSSASRAEREADCVRWAARASEAWWRRTSSATCSAQERRVSGLGVRQRSWHSAVQG